VKEDPVSAAGVHQTAGLTQTEVQAIFQLVIKRPATAAARSSPSPADGIPESEAITILAAGILKAYGFDQPSVLMVLARMWAWIEGDDDRALILTVVDRRYVGWNCLGRGVLIDTTTGDEITPSMAMPRVLESVAYNLYELLERRMATARGERVSLWEGRDAATYTPHGTATEDGDGLGEPQVLRDDAGASVP
jgi:hypothetical protein